MFFDILNLQLFAEGAAGTVGSGPADGGNNGVNGAPAAEGGAAPADQNADDLNSEFEALIGKDGKYAKIYRDRVSATVQARLKNSKAAEQQLKDLAPLLEIMSQKYGTDAGNMQALMAAVEADDTLYEEEALRRGMSVEALKEVKRIERQNKELTERENARKNQEAVDKQYQTWMQQAEKLKSQFPGFDLQAALQDPQLADLITHNIPLDVAWRVLHEDQYVPAAMQYAADAAQKAAANNIAAQRRRPAENGARAQAAANYKIDIDHMTDKDMDEINARVLRGEKVTL